MNLLRVCLCSRIDVSIQIVGDKSHDMLLPIGTSDASEAGVDEFLGNLRYHYSCDSVSLTTTFAAWEAMRRDV